MMLARGSFGWLAASGSSVALLAALETLSPHVLVRACLALSVVVLAGFLVFFRDPERIPGEGIVSPADGVIQKIVRNAGPPESLESQQPGGKGFLKIQIFMNVHNVHVNRMPMDASVIGIERRKGGFRPAFDKDAESNERVVYRLDTAMGPVYLVQIAGAVARRIVPYISTPAGMKKGERFGLIRLGSRVDVYLPEGTARPAVEKGMKVKAGTDTIAFPLDSDYSPPESEDQLHEKMQPCNAITEDEE